MQQLAMPLDNTIIEESSQPKPSNVHIEMHNDLYYVYRGTLRITKGSRHRSIIERELALHMTTKHRIVIYTDGIVEAQFSDPIHEGQWLGCISDTHYPYEAAWQGQRALLNAKQYFAKYCIDDYEVETLQTAFPHHNKGGNNV